MEERKANLIKNTSLKRIYVEISEDEMSATVVLDNPGEEEYSVPEIVHALKDNKVIMGLDTSAIMRMVSEKMYDEEIVVARGKAKIPSTDAYYDYFFDTEKHTTPIIREDGTADYSAVGRLENVNAGQIIAKYHPSVKGQNGYTVKGKELIVKIGKELPALRGQKIERNELTQEYKALISGKISLMNGNVEILDVHEVNEDVTMVQGKIEFFGDLIINGNVESGVILRAGRNIIVNGTVAAASIYAGGDVVLQKGIQGGERGKVSARGNVYSDFVEYANIEAGADVYANSIINSNVSTNGFIVVSGSRGSVIGGRAHGQRGIEVNGAGNKSEIKTVLHAGVEAEEHEKILALSQKGKVIADRIEKVLREMGEIIKVGRRTGVITPTQKQQLISLGGEKAALTKEAEKVKEDKDYLTQHLSVGNNAGIFVHGDIYRNVYICIDTEVITIMTKEGYVRFVKVNNQIERRAISR